MYSPEAQQRLQSLIGLQRMSAPRADPFPGDRIFPEPMPHGGGTQRSSVESASSEERPPSQAAPARHRRHPGGTPPRLHAGSEFSTDSTLGTIGASEPDSSHRDSSGSERPVAEVQRHLTQSPGQPPRLLLRPGMPLTALEALRQWVDSRPDYANLQSGSSNASARSEHPATIAESEGQPPDISSEIQTPRSGTATRTLGVYEAPVVLDSNVPILSGSPASSEGGPPSWFQDGPGGEPWPTTPRGRHLLVAYSPPPSERSPSSELFPSSGPWRQYSD